MTKIIITPLYYVGKDLVTEMKEEGLDRVVIVLTDDVSPLYPMEDRFYWLENSVELPNGLAVDYESIVQHDDTEEFRQEVERMIEKIQAQSPDETFDDNFKVVAFLTEDAHENLQDMDWTIKRFTPPQSADESVVDEMFSARFGKEFKRITDGKLRPKVEYEPHHVYLTFEDAGVRWYSVFTHYDGTTAVHQPAHVITNWWPSVKELNEAIVGVANVAHADMKSKRHIGWVGIKSAEGSYWVCEVEKPEWFSQQHPTFKASINMDVRFIPEPLMLDTDADPISLWVATNYKAYLEAVNAEQE